jgi:hypothetical protein
MSDFDTDTRTLSTKHGTLWLQTTLAIPFALLTLCLLIAGMVMLMSLIQGDLRVLVPLLGVVTVGYASGALATSLYFGRGVPKWFMRAFWLSTIIGIAFLIGLDIRNYFNGGQIDLVADLLLFGTGIYFGVTARQMFWKPIGK